MSAPSFSLILVLAGAQSAALFVGCDVPRDPEGTLRRVRGGVLRVGVCAAEPYVIDDGEGAPSGVEPVLLEAFAAAQGAQVQWVRGPCDDLLENLSQYELDAVVCGLNESSPWAKRVGVTRPYVDAPTPRVIATPPGENALLMALDRFIAERRSGSGP